LGGRERLLGSFAAAGVQDDLMTGFDHESSRHQAEAIGGTCYENARHA
jgi:hypothetical protein